MQAELRESLYLSLYFNSATLRLCLLLPQIRLPKKNYSGGGDSIFIYIYIVALLVALLECHKALPSAAAALPNKQNIKNLERIHSMCRQRMCVCVCVRLSP